MFYRQIKLENNEDVFGKKEGLDIKKLVLRSHKIDLGFGP